MSRCATLEPRRFLKVGYLFDIPAVSILQGFARWTRGAVRDGGL